MEVQLTWYLYVILHCCFHGTPHQKKTKTIAVFSYSLLLLLVIDYL